MQEHFAEQRRVSGEGFARVQNLIQSGFAETFLETGRFKERMDGLETRMDSLDIKLDGVLEIVQDIARRLPPTE